MEDKLVIAIWIISVLSLVCAVVVVSIDCYCRRRSLRRMYDMLQAAIDGNFQAKAFDESVYSAVENRLSEYIEAMETASAKTAVEKEQIKTLIGDISHQTKTPLANILLYTELLKEQEESAAKRQNIELLETQTEKLNFLIQSLVKLSRLETGILALHPKESRVAELLEAARKQYAGQAAEKGLYLRVLSEAAEAVTAYFDGKWTLEALGNLIDNAIKYTESGGITVSVKLYEMFVCIEVADTGVGIPEEEQARIFGRFYRSSDVSNQAGVGIGLYLAREIVRLEGGYIKVSSKPGEGSQFSMYLSNLTKLLE